MLLLKAVWISSTLFFLNLLSPVFILAQSTLQFEEQSLFIPLIDSQNKVECKYLSLSHKEQKMYFIKHSSGHYLKVTFEQQKDTVFSHPVEKFKTEIEIKSGNKSYYKKDWKVFQENNYLFFVLLLPPNYLKTTLANEGISEILVGNQSIITLSKKESQQIKEMANYLLNH